jgi:sarcosine oxidase delta subunit
MSTGLVKIPCPHCGEPVELSVREFQTAASMRCPHCASVVDFATSAKAQQDRDRSGADLESEAHPGGRTKPAR